MDFLLVLGRNSAAKEPVMVEDANLVHVPWAEANRRFFPDISCERERTGRKLSEVNTVRPDLAGTEFVDKQEVSFLRCRACAARIRPVPIAL